MPDLQQSHFSRMQQAVDIVNTSAHPINKIAATLAGTNRDGSDFSISMTNYWPDHIHARFGALARFGDASGTIHAETACLLTAPCTHGASVYVTDLFCPNCAKNMTEAGVKDIYIDEQAFEKDFATRRSKEFYEMSLPICEKAGIAVHKINRSERLISPIMVPDQSRQRHEERPVTVKPVAAADFETLATCIAEQTAIADKRKFAVALARNASGAVSALAAFGHVAVGCSWEDHVLVGDKYSFMLEPGNRVLMNAGRYGLRPVDGLFYCTRVPTAREQVNMIGAGLSMIYVGSRTDARDEFSLQAMRLLEGSRVLSFPEFRPGAL